MNQERRKRKLQPLKEDNQLDEVAQARGPQLVNNFSRYDADGYLYVAALAKQFGTDWTAENIAEVSGGEGDYGTTATIHVTGIHDAADVAKQNVYEYIYNDAVSNWGHRDAMLHKAYTKIGMGGLYDEKTNTILTAADFGEDEAQPTAIQAGDDGYIVIHNGEGRFSVNAAGQTVAD
ncbi:hypothetical protein FD25_GL001645 [Levilactobacillus acidifarinae DSM 19394]|uniref:SCP domain-containing protein n=1 Tax=Levilactobacillus acidifarinae DSM 19394 = JCM 15949 TaxID=1423715 RepID=A0A0R1LPQ7_9LACO|nr:hypothetical protein FD25_GL001645 [Levilactobacillus acidifarinae DSM 19394]